MSGPNSLRHRMVTGELSRHARLLRRRRRLLADDRAGAEGGGRWRGLASRSDISGWTPSRVRRCSSLSWLRTSHPDDSILFGHSSLCMKPSRGRVGFIHEVIERSATMDLLDVGGVPAARRRSAWTDLPRRSRSSGTSRQPSGAPATLGWQVRLRRLGNTFLYGVADQPAIDHASRPIERRS